MAVNEELVGFVRDALGRGLARPQIEDVLLRAGWNPEQVSRVLGGFADIPFAIPVPRPRPYLSAREAFIYLVLFTTLYVSAFQLVSLIFDLINVAFPDVAIETGQDYVRNDIRWSISSLIVACPVFLYVSWLAARML